MSIKRWALLAGMCAAGMLNAFAQQPAVQLSSPIPAGAAKPAAPAKAAASAPSVAANNALGVPQGQGAGVHSPNSPFAPLRERGDVVAWSVLTAITTKVDNKKMLPVFGAPQLALHQKTQRVQGFMMPLEPGPNQRHFLLTSVPLTCSFCLPGGPESMIEVRTKTPVKYSLEPVVVEGKFWVLQDDPYGLYYRITEAVAVK
jgi:uncharacterized protein